MQTTRTSWFAPKLRDAMRAQGVSSRQLCRAWRPNTDMEITRRSLNRYLKPDGVVPGIAIRRELAEALKVDSRSLEQDDDEESELLTALINRLIRKHVREMVSDAEHRSAA